LGTFSLSSDAAENFPLSLATRNVPTYLENETQHRVLNKYRKQISRAFNTCHV